MSRRAVLLRTVCTILMSLLFASCAARVTESSPTTATQATRSEQRGTGESITPKSKAANWWERFGEPQYGAAIVLRMNSDPPSWDPYVATGAPSNQYAVYERLAFPDWTLDRDIWDMRTPFVPIEYRVGCLAESWDVTHWSTIVFHIRKGVHWQNIPPVNGRELTAYDVEYDYHRLLGLGKYGFTKPSPYVTIQQYSAIKSIDANDKYTLVVNLKEPSIDTFDTLTDLLSVNLIVPPEAIQQWGDINDWHRVISTGPFILKDYVHGSAITLKKNEDYWGYDERHPNNRLPYVNQVTLLIIPDASTSQAALRTGKIDLLGASLDDELSLKKTNPELEEIPLPGAAFCLDLRCDNAPFTDIKVRQALQMSINIEELARVYYGGTSPSVPYGLIGPSDKGYYTPFNQWPEKVRNTYTYNPEGAKKLLAEAGYPNGFKTNILSSSTDDQSLIELFVGYFANIGVDAKLRILEYGSYMSSARSGGGDQMTTSGTSWGWPITRCLGRGYSTYNLNYTHNNDKTFDAMYDNYSTLIDEEKRQRLAIEANDYAIAQQWRVVGPPTVTFSLYHRWLKGYSGESPIGGMVNAQYLSRVWIDQDMKRAMGH